MTTHGVDPPPTVEELEAEARAFTEAIGGHEGAQAILAALADGRR